VNSDQVGDFVRRLGASEQVARLTRLYFLAWATMEFDPTPTVQALIQRGGWGELQELTLWLGASRSTGFVGLTREHVERLASAPHLRTLRDLSTSVIPGADAPAALATAFPALDHLCLGGLDGEGGEALARAGLTELQYLSCGFKKLSRHSPEARRQAVAALLTSPRFPKLSVFSAPEVPGLGGLGKLLGRSSCRGPTLRVLKLNGAELTPEDGAGLASCPSLRGLMALHLESNSIASEGAAAIAAGDWPRLVRLDLSSCQIGEAGAVALAGATRMPEMQGLRLNDNDLGPNGCKAFRPKQFPRLRQLSMSNCGLTPGVKGALRRRFGQILET
jgi:hypothetical protein